MKTKFQSLSLITAPTPGEKKKKRKEKEMTPGRTLPSWSQDGLLFQHS